MTKKQNKIKRLTLLHCFVAIIHINLKILLKLENRVEQCKNINVLVSISHIASFMFIGEFSSCQSSVSFECNFKYCLKCYWDGVTAAAALFSAAYQILVQNHNFSTTGVS